MFTGYTHTKERLRKSAAHVVLNLNLVLLLIVSISCGSMLISTTGGA